MNFQDLLTLMIFIFNIEERLKYLPKCEHGTHKTSNLSKVLAPSCISMIEIDLFVKFEFEYCIIATIIIAIRKVCNFIVAISLLNFVEVSKCSIYITSMIIDIYIKLIKPQNPKTPPIRISSTFIASERSAPCFRESRRTVDVGSDYASTGGRT